MILIFLIFILAALFSLYSVWFQPQDGKMLSATERLLASAFFSLFLGVGIWGIYTYYIYVRTPDKISTYATDIVAWYDANKNGQIDINQESAVIHCERDCRTYSRYKLFQEADKNKDTIVNRQEMETVIQVFDQDKNGKIDYLTESKKFYKTYPQHSTNGFRKEDLRFKEEPVVQ